MAIIKGTRTLGDIKQKYTTKNSFNKALRMDARERYIKSGGEMKCNECGQEEVDICHIKHISKYDNDALIDEINNPNNLIALCPTHHRIFDKNITKVIE